MPAPRSARRPDRLTARPVDGTRTIGDTAAPRPTQGPAAAAALGGTRVQIEVSEHIDRPPEVVFQFVGYEHVENHPRWDTAMELEKLTAGPIGVGTVIRRRHTRAGYPIEGTMEVVEFDPPRTIAMLIHDGPVDMFGRQSVAPEGEGASRLTIWVDIPGAPNPLDPMPIQNSVRRIKELIEAER
jgi:hypothetical protein